MYHLSGEPTHQIKEKVVKEGKGMMADKVKKHIIKNIVWKEIETLPLGRDIEFEWGRKRFKIKRIK